jgi:hypothetical protein
LPVAVACGRLSSPAAVDVPSRQLSCVDSRVNESCHRISLDIPITDIPALISSGFRFTADSLYSVIGVKYKYPGFYTWKNSNFEDFFG